MKINTKPDYHKSRLAAHRLLLEAKSYQFPIRLFDFIEQRPNLKIFSFCEMAELMGTSIQTVSEKMAFSNDGAIGTFGSDKVIILYNSDTQENIVERIRFTIAHELGHFFLNHPFESDNTVLSRNGITEAEDSKFEVEADNFAKELLAPTFLINLINPLETEVVSKKFEISKQASAYSIKRILDSREKKGFYLKNLEIPSFFRNSYKQFNFKERVKNTGKVGLVFEGEGWIARYKKIVYCNNCKSSLSVNANEVVNFCGICCDTNIKNIDINNYFEFHEKEEQNSMAYTELKVDEEGRVLNCPICDNDHVSENYCSVCGVYIINKCSGKSYIPVDYNEYQWSLSDEGPCENKILTGSDRYCPSCGSGSTFFINSLLKEWDTKEEEKLNANEDPFSNILPIDIPDHDLPF